MERIAKLVSTVPGVKTEILTPPSEKGNSYPTLTITWDEKKFGLTAQSMRQAAARRKSSDRRVDRVQFQWGSGERGSSTKSMMRTVSGPNQLQIFSVTMQPGQDLIVGNRIRQELEKARKQALA